MQVLVGPNVVVEEAKLVKGRLQRRAVGDEQLPEQWFEGAKQTLDPAVLPGGVLLNGLVADACKLEESVEHPAVEDGFVIGAQFAGLAMLGDGQAQMPQHRPAAAARQHLQAQRQT